MTWIRSNGKKLKVVDSHEISSARKVIHDAIQLPAMAGRSFLPDHTGDIYGNLGWHSDSFVSHPMPPDNWSVALNILELQLSVLDKNMQVLDSLPIAGITQVQAIEWLKSTIDELGPNSELLSTALPYEIPDYQQPVYHPNSKQGKELLSVLFDNYHLLIGWLRDKWKNLGEPRCWPHHFDAASSIILEYNEDPMHEKSIGIGFSPGDTETGLPYFYVNSWPYPILLNTKLPRLQFGSWNTDGWVGTSLDYVNYAGKNDQKEIILNFFNESVESLMRLMD